MIHSIIIMSYQVESIGTTTTWGTEFWYGESGIQYCG